MEYNIPDKWKDLRLEFKEPVKIFDLKKNVKKPDPKKKVVMNRSNKYNVKCIIQ